MGEEQTPRSAWGEALRVSDLGMRVVLSVAIGVGGGLWLDRKLGWAEKFPALTIVGAILGFAVGMVALVRGLTGGRKRGE